MVEPSDAEQAQWPDATRDYVADLLERISALESGRALVRAEILIDPAQAVTFTASAAEAEESSEQPALREALEGLLSFADTVVSCQESPHRGEWGHECPLCMGELVEQGDRAVIAKARAALEAGTEQ